MQINRLHTDDGNQNICKYFFKNNKIFSPACCIYFLSVGVVLSGLANILLSSVTVPFKLPLAGATYIYW